MAVFEHPEHLLLGCILQDAERQEDYQAKFTLFSNLMLHFIKFRMLFFTHVKKARTQCRDPHHGMQRREECEICGEIV